MSTGDQRHTHVFRFEPHYPVERQMLTQIVRPGARVLDVGTAATGRSARLLRELGCEVHSIEINIPAVAEFAQRDDSPGIYLAGADVCALPYPDRFFELVLVAFHGLDYLTTREHRGRAFREIDRVLGPRGALVFNSFNRLGLILSPSGLLSRANLALRARHILSGRFLKRTLIDVNQLELYQETPYNVIRHVRQTTDLHLDYATNLSGKTRNLLALTLLASSPYYVFSRR